MLTFIKDKLKDSHISIYLIVHSFKLLPNMPYVTDKVNSTYSKIKVNAIKCAIDESKYCDDYFVNSFNSFLAILHSNFVIRWLTFDNPLVDNDI